VLENVPSLPLNEVVFRFASERGLPETLRAMGLDPEDVRETLGFLGEHMVSERPEALLDGPFEDKPQLRPQPSRFSDGTWKVFYSALDLETARTEVAHAFVRAALEGPAGPRYCRYFRCACRGRGADLRPLVAEWPALLGDQWELCQGLGREGVRAGLDAFLAPSARAPQGTNVAVFSRPALADPVILGLAAVRRDPVSGRAVWTATGTTDPEPEVPRDHAE
jgi:hypothetical protein